MRYQDLKACLYWTQSAFGLLLIALALRLTDASDATAQLAAWLLVLVGSLLTLFGILTFVLKDDPDIWR